MDRRVGNRNGVQVIVRGQFPGNVVIRLTASFGKILRSEQIDGVIAVWLVEPNDVSAGGIIPFFEI